MVATRQSSGHTGISDGPSTSSSEGKSSKNEPPLAPTATLFDLPPEILDKVFGYFKYKQISQLRTVCRSFDEVSSRLLNTGFARLQTKMMQRFQSIKARMPRRESARRNHPLACESDIVETIHMRLTLLHMTFGKHIERRHCCFFPGEILDEVNRILNYIEATSKLTRPYKVTDELFDLSTMAMEYFKDKIEPTLPEISYFDPDFLEFTNSYHQAGNSSKYTIDSPKGDESPSHCSSATPTTPPTSSQALALTRTAVAMKKRMNRMRITLHRTNTQMTALRREVRNLRNSNAEQRAQLAECKTRIDECDKKNEEMTRKFGTLLQELNKCKTEFQYWRSKSPAITCGSCGHIVHPAHEAIPGQLCPVAGPSNQGEAAQAAAPVEEAAAAVPTSSTATADAPRAKRKREASSLDSKDSRKSTRGRKKSKF
ncbi:F-box only protein 28 [Neocloeon triangulifer]|uniref:F-box only protein 28 n=1 Tax=Neocloeon triangulifer TaxID=2078957 RepID=UPI00286F9875|nr:F-box only protein 28 [Neocloeon triangulifer]